VTDSPPPAPPDYFLEIEAHFAARRGTPFILSAKDWALMKSWFDGGIPLPIVIEALDTVFENNETSGRKKVISSLSYCRHAVKELWQERKDLQVGDREQSPEVAPEILLGELAAELARSAEAAPEALRDTIANCAAAIRSLHAEKSVPAIEERLMTLEQQLVDSLVALADPESIAAIRAEIDAALTGSGKIDEKTRVRTEEANLRRLLRQRLALPRLTLFR
jgi:hypothetical protein